jgi:short subunit fatty acids transporter
VFVDVYGVIALSRSVFTLYAFGLAVLVFITVVPTVYLLAPDEEDATGIEEYAPGYLSTDETPASTTTSEEDSDPVATDGGTAAGTTPADRLNNSRSIAYIIGLGMLVYIGVRVSGASFVPSGGGEWGIIGGIVGRAANQLGVPAGKAIVAYGVGDMHTNMFQPFWAIPLLGITRMRARDILGYTLIVMVALTPIFAIGLYFLPYTT